MPGAAKRFRWVYFPPLFHLSLCSLVVLGLTVPDLKSSVTTWNFLMLADLPISLVAFALAWNHSSLAAVWIAVAGTLWWYLLACGVDFVLARFKHGGKSS